MKTINFRPRNATTSATTQLTTTPWPSGTSSGGTLEWVNSIFSWSDFGIPMTHRHEIAFRWRDSRLRGVKMRWFLVVFSVSRVHGAKSEKSEAIRLCTRPSAVHLWKPHFSMSSRGGEIEAWMTSFQTGVLHRARTLTSLEKRRRGLIKNRDHWCVENFLALFYASTAYCYVRRALRNCLTKLWNSRISNGIALLTLFARLREVSWRKHYRNYTVCKMEQKCELWTIHSVFH